VLAKLQLDSLSTACKTMFQHRTTINNLHDLTRGFRFC